MKRSVVFSFVFLSFSIGSAWPQIPETGDICTWIPFERGISDPKDAQLIRNTQYVSIGIEAVHVSYKAGFFRKIKKIVVSSSLSFDLGNKKVQASLINQTWNKSSNNFEENIPVLDQLVELSPLTPTGISIKIGLFGIGEDRFKGIFDILSGQDVKTAISLSPAAITKAASVTTIVQKLLASPYTDTNPLNVLSMSKGFIIYPDKDAFRRNSLREGYFIIISATGNKNADLNRFQTPQPDSIRFDEQYNLLQLKQEDGTWKSFTGNSYIVLSVTGSPVRGEDQESDWFKKFTEAKRTVEKLQTGEKFDSIKTDALSLWKEGVTLLSADSNFIEQERISIRSKWISEIQNDLNKYSPSKVDLTVDVPGIPQNLSAEVTKYQKQLLEISGNLIIQVVDKNGSPIPGTSVNIISKQQTKTFNADEKGFVQVRSLAPGTYSIEAALEGFQSFKANVKIAPKQKKKLTILFDPTS